MVVKTEVHHPVYSLFKFWSFILKSFLWISAEEIYYNIKLNNQKITLNSHFKCKSFLQFYRRNKQRINRKKAIISKNLRERNKEKEKSRYESSCLHCKGKLDDIESHSSVNWNLSKLILIASFLKEEMTIDPARGQICRVELICFLWVLLRHSHLLILCTFNH